MNRNQRGNYSDREISSSSKGVKKKNPKAVLKKLNAKRTIAMILCILFLLTGSGMIYYYKMLDSMSFVEFETDPASETSPGKPDEGSLGQSELLSNSQILNIMLFGDDSRDETGEAYGRSDTMLLLSVDARHKKMKLTSFQRDIYVSIPGYGYNKLNASYSFGGPQLAIRTIQANFGVNIDRYAVVGFESFKNIIDTLGGVDIELTYDEIRYINFKMKTESLVADPGIVHLNGVQALWYARNRGSDEAHISGDDWDRTGRQRNLLKVLMKSLKSASFTQLLSIINQIGPMITTNLKKDEITVLASNVLKYLNYDTVETSVPMQGIWKYSWSDDGQSIIEITDWKSCRTQVAEFIFEDLLVTGAPQN